ncbi:MAG TPA: hypothetical protein V6D07_00780 [Trichocoleus sp.]
MRYLQRLTGIALTTLGLYFLAKNILVTTNPQPYWWRGFMADSSILLLALGLLMLVLIPFSALRQIGSIFFVVGVLCVFNSRYAILTPLGIGELISAILAIASGYLFYISGKLRN